MEWKELPESHPARDVIRMLVRAEPEHVAETLDEFRNGNGYQFITFNIFPWGHIHLDYDDLVEASGITLIEKPVDPEDAVSAAMRIIKEHQA